MEYILITHTFLAGKRWWKNLLLWNLITRTFPRLLNQRKWNCLRSYKRCWPSSTYQLRPAFIKHWHSWVKLLKIIHSLLCTLQNPPKWVVRYIKTLLVIDLFVCMLYLLTVFNYLSDFHSGGPIWVVNIFEENILDHSPSICFKTSVKLLHSHLYLSWMINSRLSILESTSFCSFLRNYFMLHLSYS